MIVSGICLGIASYLVYDSFNRPYTNKKTGAISLLLLIIGMLVIYLT